MTMKSDLLALLLRRWVTPRDALDYANCFSLSQRCGEFRREYDFGAWGHGSKIPRDKWPPLILDKWVKLPSGKRVKAYRALK